MHDVIFMDIDKVFDTVPKNTPDPHIYTCDHLYHGHLFQISLYSTHMNSMHIII